MECREAQSQPDRDQLRSIPAHHGQIHELSMEYAIQQEHESIGQSLNHSSSGDHTTSDHSVMLTGQSHEETLMY